LHAAAALSIPAMATIAEITEVLVVVAVVAMIIIAGIGVAIDVIVTMMIGVIVDMIAATIGGKGTEVMNGETTAKTIAIDASGAGETKTT
jgi:hypothetical protein